MKIAFAKINQTVGDVAGNTEKVLRYIKNADSKKCDLTVFPKFSIRGGYCGHLEKNKDFVEAVDLAEKNICEFKKSCMVCGFRQVDIKNLSVVSDYTPYYEGKFEEIKNKIKHSAIKNKRDFVYLNMLGGHDGYVFDGLALYVDKTGDFKLIDCSFDEKLIVLDTDKNIVKYEAPCREEELYNTLVFGFKDYMRKCGFTKAVLGISGGIDSALTAAIAVDALGAKNVLGVLMPSKYTSEESNKYARELCNNLKIETKIIPIEKLYKAYIKEFTPIFEGKQKDLTEENLQARIRSNILMALSNKFGYIVLCTGNKSEDAVGYSTLYGDTSGGYAPISDLLKKDVYALAKYRNKIKKIIPNFIIDRAPTAELRENQKDSDSLPEYDVLDDVLEKILDKNMRYDEILDTGVSSKVLDKVWKLIKSSEYKRRQSPIGTKVSKSAFLRDVKFPLVNGYIWKKMK